MCIASIVPIDSSLGEGLCIVGDTYLKSCEYGRLGGGIDPV